ncbi:13030_t:CDS:1, partial [Racocetra fulgida]
LKMAIINLNCVLLNDNGTHSEDEIFTIEISNDKKYELLKHMVKERLAPFFDSVPSTKIRLRLSPNGNNIKPLIRISDDFPTSPSEEDLIYVVPTPKK